MTQSVTFLTLDIEICDSVKWLVKCVIGVFELLSLLKQNALIAF